MSSLVIHLVVPVLIALSSRLFRPRDCFIWSWVAVAPDLDYFTWNNQIPGIPNLHRGLLHNFNILGILLVATLLAYRYYRVKNPGADVAGFIRSRMGAAWILSTFYYTSQLVLDLFAGGIVPFYPLSTTTWELHFVIEVDTSTNEPTVDGGGSVTPTVPNVVDVFPWLTSEHTAILLLVVLSGALVVLGHWLLRRRPVTTVEARRVELP